MYDVLIIYAFGDWETVTLDIAGIVELFEMMHHDIGMPHEKFSRAASGSEILRIEVQRQGLTP